jgi:regulator of sigma E protease
MPAAKAGIQKGDRVVAIDGRAVESWAEFSRTIKEGQGKPVALAVERDGRSVAITVQPVEKDETDPVSGKRKVWLIGLTPEETVVKVSPVTAVARALKHTADVSVLTVVALFKMVKGDISPKTLGGPLLIAQVAGQQAREGVTTFFLFVALLSINLGVLNLLPIPVLDGGHLFFFLIEAVLGRPVGEKQRERAQQVGVVLLILVMAYAFYNDIARFFES